MSQEPEKTPQDQPRPGSERRHKKPSVMVYLVILFAAAFLLMAWSYFIQQRSNQEAISDLEASANSAVQRLENVFQENENLKAQVAELEEELSDAQAQVAELSGAVSQQERLLEQTCLALDYFWQIDEAYVRGRYTLCRKLIEAMEDSSHGEAPLKEYLPTESGTDTDRFSPAQRYQEIYDELY